MTKLFVGLPVNSPDVSIDWLERLAADGLDHEAVQTYSNGARHVKLPNPGANAIALASRTDAA